MNSPQAAGNGRHRGALPVPSVREGVLLCPVLSRVAEHDLETLFWQWGERFPSLAGMERWQWQDMPFWQVIAEAGMAARVVGHAVREMERWMVPNKLREAA